jgi:hypothetical protein
MKNEKDKQTRIKRNGTPNCKPSHHGGANVLSNELLKSRPGERFGFALGNHLGKMMTNWVIPKHDNFGIILAPQ